MTSAAFAMPDDSRQRVTLRRRATNAATTTSAAADEALQHVLDRRLRKREGRLPPPSRQGAVRGGAAAIAPSGNRFGSPQWLLRAGVLGGLVVGVVYSLVVFRGAKAPVSLHPISASVTVGRAVPVGARVVLHPRSGQLPGDAVPQGTVGEDGSVTFVTYPPFPGVPAGEYVATVQWFKVGADGSVGGNVVPARYASVAQSPLTIKVLDGGLESHVLQVPVR